MSDRRQYAKQVGRSEVVRPELSNIDSEQLLLGAIMTNNDFFWAVADTVKESDFTEPLHRTVYRNSDDLIRKGRQASPVTLLDFMDRAEKVGEVDLATYLSRLVRMAIEQVVAIVGVRSYGRSVHDMAVRRGLASLGEELVADVYGMQANGDPKALAETYQTRIMEAVTSNRETMGAVSFGDAITSAIDTANMAYMADGDDRAAIRYGFAPLERLIGPIFGGQLIILGGATKQGKTALVGQIAVGAAMSGVPVDFYSGEMTPKELAMREIARQTGIQVGKQKRGELKEEQFAKMIEVQRYLKDLPVVIQDKRMTLPQLKERWRRVARKRGRTVFICDHVGLLDRDKDTAKMDPWQFGEHVTRELKATARDLDCPVIACVQLKKNTFADGKAAATGRGLDAIIRRRPRYADLTGGVEKDADHVIIPFRPEVFLSEHEPTPGTDFYAKWEEKMNAWRGRAQLVLALSRETKWPQHVDVGWDGPATSFFDLGSVRDEPAFAPAETLADPMRLF